MFRHVVSFVGTHGKWWIPNQLASKNSIDPLGPILTSFCGWTDPPDPLPGALGRDQHPRQCPFHHSGAQCLFRKLSQAAGLKGRVPLSKHSRGPRAGRLGSQKKNVSGSKWFYFVQPHDKIKWSQFTQKRFCSYSGNDFLQASDWLNWPDGLERHLLLWHVLDHLRMH